jgi:uroporphyrin-III C-methyltransferase
MAPTRDLPRTPAPVGQVILVGAGPGDPDLLTRKALAAIARADVLFYDDLVSTEILAEIPPGVRCVYVGKPRGTDPAVQGDIIAHLIAAARVHPTVVRLKGGDPLIFGRGGEEIDALRAAGIAVEVVPGITAAAGAAAATLIPLTHRDHAAQVSFTTAVRKDGGVADVRGLAGPGRTLVIYMGVGQAAALADALRKDDVPGTWPVAIVEKATRPDQRLLVTTVDALAKTVADQAVTSPALFIVGTVAQAVARPRQPEPSFHWAHFAHG